MCALCVYFKSGLVFRDPDTKTTPLSGVCVCDLAANRQRELLCRDRSESCVAIIAVDVSLVVDFVVY